jgi:chromosome segregation ATPase
MVPPPQVLRDPVLVGNIRMQGVVHVNGKQIGGDTVDTVKADAPRVDAVFESQKKIQRAVELLNEKVTNLSKVHGDASNVPKLHEQLAEYTEKWSTIQAEHGSLKNLVASLQLQIQQQLDTNRQLQTKVGQLEEKAKQPSKEAESPSTASAVKELRSHVDTAVGDLTKKVFLLEKKLPPSK